MEESKDNRWYLYYGITGQGQELRIGFSGGQVHALNTAPVQDRGSISVESLVYISGFPVRTLFDSDASSSFISSLLVESLHLDTSLVDDPLVVSNPIGAP